MRARSNTSLVFLGPPAGSRTPSIRRSHAQTIDPHNKVLSAVGVQKGQEFFEVWVHPEPRPSLRTKLA